MAGVLTGPRRRMGRACIYMSYIALRDPLIFPSPPPSSPLEASPNTLHDLRHVMTRNRTADNWRNSERDASQGTNPSPPSYYLPRKIDRLGLPWVG